MKKNAMDAVATLWRKDPNSENGLLTNAVKLENEAVFGRLEEPLIVAPDMEARRGNSHVERCPVGGLSRKASHQQRGGTTMEVLYPRCSGLDVHKRFVVACLSVVEANGQRHKELRQFGTMTSEILELKDWLKASGCRQVAMESTGVYWKPIFHLLEGEFEIVLVNAQHMKAVPGRKTDLKDAEWIADLLQHGLLKASFIPSSEQQAVRDLTRSRMSLTQERNRLINRVQKVLEDANIKLASVVSDLMGKTGHAILMALVAGEVDPEYLARLAQGRLVKKQAQLQAALAGKLTAHHRMLLRELLELLAVLDHSIDRFDREIAERLRPYDALIERIDEVTGLSRRGIEVLLGELGWDMSRFPDAAHAASWVGICPGQRETGGKRLSGRIRQGNRWAKTVLVQAAHAAGHTQTYLGEQYRRISARRGAKRAAVAVGHSILVIFYQMVKTGEPYQEKGTDYFTESNKQKIQKRLIRQLERLGNTVILQPKVETTLA
jgi:transposase